MPRYQKGIDTGSSFSVTTKKDDGSKVERYYAPIKAVNQTWWAASALNKTDLERNTIILVVFMNCYFDYNFSNYNCYQQ